MVASAKLEDYAGASEHTRLARRGAFASSERRADGTSELVSELVKKTPGPVARRQRRVSYGGDGGWGFWPNSLAT